MTKIVSVLALALLLSSCASYKYVPPTKRAAKKAVEREISKINYKEKRLKAISLSYPELTDTTRNKQQIKVVTVYIHDTTRVNIPVVDTKKVENLKSKVDSLLLIANTPPEIIEKIRRVLQPITILKDTSFLINANRKLIIGKDTLLVQTRAIVIIKEGNISYSLRELPVDTSVIVSNEKVTFDVKRLPGILRWPLEIIGTILLLAIIGFILYYGIKIGRKFIKI